MAEIETRRCLECGQVLPLTDFRKNNKMRGGYTNRCKPCLLALDRARWDAMPPDQREATKARYRAQLEAYWRANPEKRKAQKAQHYQRTKERCKERCYQWRKNNPERFRVLARGWCTKRYRGIRGGLTAAQLADWAQAQKKVCHWCGCRCAKQYEIDHIVPLAKGGKHVASNLAIACPPCNKRKSAKDPIEWARMIGKLL